MTHTPAPSLCALLTVDVEVDVEVEVEVGVEYVFSAQEACRACRLFRLFLHQKFLVAQREKKS